MNRQEYLASVSRKQACICRNCGTWYHPKRADRSAYCSRECYFAAKTAKKIEREKAPKVKHIKSCKVFIGKCEVCGELFTSRRPRARCGRSCDVEHARSRNRALNESKKQPKPTKCKECGRVFVSEYGNKRRAFCSEVCLQRNIHRKRRQKERAVLRSVKVETVDAIRVFERDNWKCQLCGKRLKQAHRGTARDDAPELDHIIPLSKGGEHSYRNTACSCRKCNQYKGGVEIGQLRLFG